MKEIVRMAAIFKMFAKPHKHFKVLQFQKRSNAPITKNIDIDGFLEECDRDQCDFKMAVILAAIFKMAAKMRKISKCVSFNKN